MIPRSSARPAWLRPGPAIPAAGSRSAASHRSGSIPVSAPASTSH